MSERSKISRHEVEVYRVLVAKRGGWITNREIAESVAVKVSERTVRLVTMKLVKMGLLDRAEVFPAHRFKLSDKADKRSRVYSGRINKAAEVFGVDIR